MEVITAQILYSVSEDPQNPPRSANPPSGSSPPSSVPSISQNPPLSTVSNGSQTHSTPLFGSKSNSPFIGISRFSPFTPPYQLCILHPATFTDSHTAA